MKNISYIKSGIEKEFSGSTVCAISSNSSNSSDSNYAIGTYVGNSFTGPTKTVVIGMGSNAKQDNSVVIGIDSESAYEKSIIIGSNSECTHEGSVVIGNNLKSYAKNSMYIGSYEFTNDKLEMSDGKFVILSDNLQNNFICHACKSNIIRGIKCMNDDNTGELSLCFKCIYDSVLQFHKTNTPNKMYVEQINKLNTDIDYLKNEIKMLKITNQISAFNHDFEIDHSDNFMW